MRKSAFFFAILTLASSVTFASVNPVPASLRSTVSQNVGKTSVTIDYSRPNAKGRDVFGKLVPYGEVWRTGANMCSSIEFNTDVALGGTVVPAGRYGLFSVPGEKEWTIILNSNADQFGAFTYNAEDDILRFAAKAHPHGASTETFEIVFTDAIGNTANIELRWQDTAVSFPIAVTDQTNDQVILSEIQRFVIDAENPTWGDLGEAARFYAKKGMDLEQAAKWYEQSLALNPKAFWLFVEQANVYKQLDQKKAAKNALLAGLESAKSQNNQGGVDWINGEIAKL